PTIASRPLIHARLSHDRRRRPRRLPSRSTQAHRRNRSGAIAGQSLSNHRWVFGGRPQPGPPPRRPAKPLPPHPYPPPPLVGDPTFAHLSHRRHVASPKLHHLDR